MNALLLADCVHTTIVIAAFYVPVCEILLADCCSGQKMIMTIDIIVPNFVLDNIYYCQHFLLGSSKQKVFAKLEMTQVDSRLPQEAMFYPLIQETVLLIKGVNSGSGSAVSAAWP